ncbi:MAG: DUF4395 domain-containing protein [Paludibacter sp.]|jgi:hypothetical protein|nr:DUF4395 domain-containing protein [Paludibacter sp.]
MQTNAFCPISYKKIDENVARLNGFFTVVFLGVYVLTSSLIPVVFLVLDFLARGFEKPEYSLLARFSKFLLAAFKVRPQLINAGPKIFAARVGLLFSVLVVITALPGWNTVALVITLVFGVCALLEAAVGFCVACKLYPFVYKLTYQKPVDKIVPTTDFQI